MTAFGQTAQSARRGDPHRLPPLTHRPHGLPLNGCERIDLHPLKDAQNTIKILDPLAKPPAAASWQEA